MALVTINSHLHFFDATDVKITKVSNGRWNVVFDGHEFTVVGGRHSGGASNEWFCHRPLIYGDRWVPCKSMVAALRLGITY